MTNHLLGHGWSVNWIFWHNRLGYSFFFVFFFDIVGIRIWRSWVAKSGRAEILELLFWTGSFKILVKTLMASDIIFSFYNFIYVYLSFMYNSDFDGGGYGKISASDASPKRRQRHDSDDNSPPRSRQRHDSDDSPPRGRLGSDSDQSPPRTKRGKSEDSTASPPRKNRHDSDESPPRRRQDNSDSDHSPPRRKRNDSDSDQSPPRRNRQNADSDQSPPRRKRQDSDQSPPRRKRQNSDSDQSPPRRRKTGGGDSDSSPPRKNKETKATKTLSGAKAGLSSAREMKHEAERVKRREAEAFGKVWCSCFTLFTRENTATQFNVCICKSANIVSSFFLNSRFSCMHEIHHEVNWRH